MLWKKQTLCCGFVGETAETELGRYDIIDATISQYGSICAGFKAAAGPGAQPRKHQCPRNVLRDDRPKALVVGRLPPDGAVVVRD